MGGIETMAGGLYLTGYARGPYGSASDLPRRMTDYAKRKGLTFTGPRVRRVSARRVKHDEPGAIPFADFRVCVRGPPRSIEAYPARGEIEKRSLKDFRRLIGSFLFRAHFSCDAFFSQAYNFHTIKQ
jgi:hypothetical protein